MLSFHSQFHTSPYFLFQFCYSNSTLRSSFVHVDQIFRVIIFQEPPTKGVVLSGYGVELAIKSTEYKAQDDTKVEGSQ